MTYGNGAGYPVAQNYGQTPGYQPDTTMPKVVTDLQRAIDELRQSAAATQAAQQRTADPEFVRQAESICKGIFHMLCDKNAAYGNSALDPVRIFSRASVDEQLNVRADDKLSRIKRGHEVAGENDIIDLIGYLIIKLIAKQRETQ